MNKLNYEILSAIDNIETTVMESEMNVMNSLIASYDKAVMILEHCDDNNDVSSYDIFQESVIMEADTVDGFTIPPVSRKKTVKQVIVDILLFLPRLIKKFLEVYVKGVGDLVIGMSSQRLSNFNIKEGFPLTFGLLKYEYYWHEIESGFEVSSSKVSLNKNHPLVKMVKNAFNKNKNKVKRTKNSINENIKIEIVEDRKDVNIECLSFFNTVTYYVALSKNIDKIINDIDGDKMLKDETYNRQLFDKLNGIISDLGTEPTPENRKHSSIFSYEEYVKSCKKGFDSVMDNLKKCQNKITKIAESIKNIPENDSQSQSIDKNSPIMKSVVAIQNVFSKITSGLTVIIENFEQSVERVNASINSISEAISNKPDGPIVESYYTTSDEQVIQEFFFTNRKNIKKRMMKYFPDFLDDMKRLNEACENDELTVGMVSRMYKSSKTTYRTSNTSEDGRYTVEMDKSFEVQTKHMKKLLAVNEYCDKACSRKRCEGAFTSSEIQDIYELNEQIENLYYDLLDLFVDESERSLSKIDRDIKSIYPLAKKVREYLD